MAAESPFTPGRSRRFRPGLVTGPRIRQNYVSVPKPQQKLLDRDDAWSGNLGGGSHSFVNVPSDVLEGVKAAYAHQKAPKRHKPSTPSLQSSSPVGRTPMRQLRSSVESLPQHRSHESPSAVASQEVDDGGDEVSWPSSPQRPPLQSPQNELPSDKETDTQTTPVKEPSSPHRPVRDAARAHYMTNFPSSAIDEPDLELEEPGVLNQQPNPVRKPALLTSKLPEPTPPSAQLPVIPCSFNYDKSPEKLQRVPRSGLMKALKFDKSKSGAQATGPDITRLQPKSAELPRIGSSSPASIRSEKHITRKLAAIPVFAAATPTFVPPSYESSRVPETSPFQRIQLGSSKIQRPGETAVIQESSLEDNEAQEIQQAQEEFHSQLLDKDTIANSVSGSPPNTGKFSPWDTYRKTYPDFRGSISDFVKACLCVKDLQSKKALPVFLYDDFIRTFTTDYLAYIRSLEHDEDSQPLTAIQWYNENVESASYNKLVITRQDLEVVLDGHPDEVSSARLSIGLSDDAIQQTQTVREPATQPMDDPIIIDDSLSSDSAVQNTQTLREPATQLFDETDIQQGSTSSEDAVQQTQAIREPATQVVEEPTVMRLDSPELSLPSVKDVSIVEDVQGEVLGNHRDTVADMGSPPTSPRSTAFRSSAAFRERNLLQEPKRRSMPNTIHKTLYREPSLEPPPTASSASSVRSRKRRLTETPEQRSKRLKAFFEKRKQEGLRLSGYSNSSKRT